MVDDKCLESEAMRSGAAIAVNGEAREARASDCMEERLRWRRSDEALVSKEGHPNDRIGDGVGDGLRCRSRRRAMTSYMCDGSSSKYLGATERLFGALPPAGNTGLGPGCCGAGTSVAAD